jgi:hypothetical protein
MDPSSLDFYLNQQIQVNLFTFVQSIIVAALLSFLIQLVYVKFSNSLSNKDDFSKNFIVLGLATTLVITIVKSSLALSLGLVGALSIVRFRAAIKDPEELVYLFLVIASGLGCGAGQIKITSIGISSALIIIIIFNLYYKRKKNIFSEDLINASFIYDKKITSNEIDKLTDKINKHCNKVVFVSFSATKDQSTINLDIVPKKFNSISQINDEVSRLDKNIKVIFAKDNYLSL